MVSAWVKKNDKWGFIDKTGKEIASCIYDDVSYFSEGLADVKKNGYWGYIDETGKEVIPCIYDRAGSFCEGLAKIEKDGKWGLLDGEDNEILKPMFYDEIEVIKILSDDYVKINLDGRETIVNKNGKIIS